jgi:hypothetical protein
MKSDEAFVEQECLVFQPILNVAEELSNALQNVAGITADVQFMLAIVPAHFQTWSNILACSVRT